MTVDPDAALLAAIEAAPHDEAARQVYADWLLERGDARGELLTMQLARHRDPFWAAPRLERREKRLIERLPRPSYDASMIHDRGEQGLAFDLRRYEQLARYRLRWARPEWPANANHDLYTQSACLSFLEVLRDDPAFAQIYRLDLSKLGADVPWQLLLTSPARPRHVVLPIDAGKHVDALVEAPLLADIETLELRGSCDDAAITRLAAAPWARKLTTVICGPRRVPARWWRNELGPVTDEGLARLARLPRMGRLDARANAITAAGFAAVVAARPPLVELRLSLDALGTEGLAAVERSPYAGVTQVSLAGLALPAPEPVVALAHSACWDGTLDLAKLPRWNQGQPIDLEVTIVEALTRDTPTRPLLRLRVGELDDKLEPFLCSPTALTLTHLTTARPASFGDSAMRLDTLHVTRCDPATLRAVLRAPALGDVRGLFIEAVSPAMIRVLAESPIRPLDLALVGDSTTRSTCALVRSPVVERVTDLMLALWGNHAAKDVVAALVETPYLQDIQHLELDFAAKFPAAKRARLGARFGAAIDTTTWR